MTADPLVMRSDDERRAALEAEGWSIVARSWGAQLDTEQIDGRALQRARDAAAAPVRELLAEDAQAVLELDAATLGDYPGGTATRHEPLTPERAVPSLTRRGFGALDDGGTLVAMTWVDVDGDRAETDFTVVRASERGRGFASAVKAASVLALVDAGVTRFRTGGSSENLASIAANRRLGYVLDEEWVTLAPAAPESRRQPRPDLVSGSAENRDSA